MSEIPTDIKDIEAARTWLLRHGYSAEMAEEELAKWEAPAIIEDIEEEVESEIEADIEAEELTWDDEDEDDEDEDWDDEEEEDDDWDEDDDDEDEEDK